MNIIIWISHRKYSLYSWANKNVSLYFRFWSSKGYYLVFATDYVLSKSNQLWGRFTMSQTHNLRQSEIWGYKCTLLLLVSVFLEGLTFKLYYYLQMKGLNTWITTRLFKYFNISRNVSDFRWIYPIPSLRGQNMFAHSAFNAQ